MKTVLATLMALSASATCVSNFAYEQLEDRYEEANEAYNHCVANHIQVRDGYELRIANYN